MFFWEGEHKDKAETVMCYETQDSLKYYKRKPKWDIVSTPMVLYVN